MAPRQVIKRSSSDIGGVVPRALAVLSSRFTSPKYHHDKGLRAPFGIYAVSIDNVIDAFERVPPNLDKALKSDLTFDNLAFGWDDDLLGSIQRLLYSLMEHFDDCESILKGFLRPGVKHSRVKEIRNYESAISKYRTHIGKVVNHIKHK